MKSASRYTITLVALAGLAPTACRVRQCDVLYDEFSPILAPDGLPDGFTTETVLGETLTLRIIGKLWNPDPLQFHPLLGGPVNLTVPNGGARRPQANHPDLLMGLNYVRLNDVDITLSPTKTAIDDSDHLDYRVAWHRPLSTSARTLLSNTFEFVEFPNAFVLKYAGPAPQGFDLAAAIGIRQAEMNIDSADIELETDDDWPALVNAFLVSIDPNADTVMINGITALTLSEDAHVLD